MNTRNRNLFALAWATVLLSPAASVGQGIGQGPPDIPHTVSTQGTLSQGMPTTNPPERTMEEMRKAEASAQEQTPPPRSPVQSQGGEHAAPPASVVQRDEWMRLDSDGDGRISATESAVDAEFNTGFAAMDADRDGFVTDTEYRSAAKAGMDTGRGGMQSSSHSASSMGDAMRRLDTNADGSISMSEGEADAAIRSSFATIDANSDGMVTRTEYQAWLKATRK